MIETHVVTNAEIRFGMLKESVQKKAIRRGITKLSRTIAKTVKQRAPKEIGGKGSLARARAGTYKKAIGQKVKTYNAVCMGIIGARRGFKKVIGIRQKGKNKGKPIVHDPANIGHLIERGHGGPAPAQPHPHLAPALHQHKGEAPAVIGQEVNVEIEKLRIR